MMGKRPGPHEPRVGSNGERWPLCKSFLLGLVEERVGSKAMPCFIPVKSGRGKDSGMLKTKIPNKLFHVYSFDKPSKALLSRDITCFIGSEDVIKDVEGWKDITSGNFDVHKLPGDHFYLMKPDNENFIKNYIAKCLELSSLDCL